LANFPWILGPPLPTHAPCAKDALKITMPPHGAIPLKHLQNAPCAPCANQISLSQSCVLGPAIGCAQTAPSVLQACTEAVVVLLSLIQGALPVLR
jgi:hypothetical protein